MPYIRPPSPSPTEVSNGMVSQTSDDPTDVVRISYAAEIIKQHQQLIECPTPYHNTCTRAKIHTLRETHAIDGPRAIVGIYPAPSLYHSVKN